MQASIKSVDGKVVSEKSWGERELAYPIDKAVKAFYYTWIVKLDPAKISDFKEKINFGEKCMRYLIVSVDEDEIDSSSKK